MLDGGPTGNIRGEILLALMVLILLPVSGCAGLGPSRATAELRVQPFGSGVATPRAAINMFDVLEAAKDIRKKTRFRDEVEAMLTGKVTLPYDWPSRIDLGVNQEQMELLVSAQIGRGDDAARVVNTVGRKIAEYLKRTRRYSVHVSRPAR